MYIKEYLIGRDYESGLYGQYSLTFRALDLRQRETENDEGGEAFPSFTMPRIHADVPLI